MATYELKRSEVRDAIVDTLREALNGDAAIRTPPVWDDSSLYDIASNICDDLDILWKFDMDDE